MVAERTSLSSFVQFPNEIGAQRTANLGEKSMVKRAITLGGGGPAAGLHIGVLEALATAGIEFDIWALSCIGAWVGIVYNQFGDADDPKEKNKKIENKDRAELTYQFFKNGVFRDDEGYEHFPINKVFGTDWRSNTKALNKFIANPDNYEDFAWDPYRVMDSFQESMSLFFDHMPGRDKKFKKLDEGDVNGWILNQALAPNPFVRYLTSMMYLSDVTGLARINYPDSEFMKSIKFANLFEKSAANGKEPEKKPLIFHNAWNLDKRKLALFSNKPIKDEAYQGEINATTMCACSALPYIEQTVKIGGDTYCEGALVDTVNFHSLIEEHGDTLDEIWVSRIVDSQQVRKPKNLHDSLANLCELFAATVGEDDVKLFKYHLKEEKKWKGTVIEIHVPAHIDFKWNHENLNKGRELGKAAAKDAIEAYKVAGAKTPANDQVRFINENPTKEKGERESLDKWCRREGINRDLLKEVILKLKSKSDPILLAKKMTWFVDINGDRVQSDRRGEFPDGSVPYAVFAMRNAAVRKAYRDRDPGPDLEKL
jgi:predicted acylesterase/phospholipase RssA